MLSFYFKFDYNNSLKLKWKEFIKLIDTLNKMLKNKEIQWINY